MQLIDTDSDIVVEVKMSTIQQESLEKFSLVEAICDNMSEIDGGDESSRNEDAFEASEERVNVDKLNAQNIATSHEPNVNERKCENNDGASEKRDEESSKGNSKPEEYQNTQIVDMAKKNCKIVSKPRISNEDEIELEVSCVDKLKNMNNSDIENRNSTMQPHSVVDNSAIDKVEEREVKDTITEDFKATSDMEDKMEKPQEENIEIYVSHDECEKGENNETKDAIAKEAKESSLLEDRIQNKTEEDIELNVTKENNEIVSTQHGSEETQNEENIVMDVSLEDHDKELHIVADRKTVNETKETTEEKIDSDIDMDVTLEGQNKVNIEVAKNEITLNHTENNTGVNCNEENITINVPLQENDEAGSFKENKIEKETSCSSEIEGKIGEAIEEVIETDVTLEVPDEVNTSVLKRKIVKEIEHSNETDVTSEKLLKKDIEMSVTEEDQNKVTSNTTGVNVGDVNMKGNSEIRDKNEDNVDMEVSFEELRKDDSSVTEDQNEKQIVENLDKSLEEQNEENIRVEGVKETSETKNLIEVRDKNEENVDMEVSFEELRKDDSSVTEDQNEKQIVENLDKSLEEQNEENIRVEGVKETSETKNLIEVHKEDIIKMNVTIKEEGKDVLSVTEASITEDKIEQKELEVNVNDDVLDEPKGIVGEIQDTLEKQKNDDCYIKDKLELHNAIREIPSEQAATNFVTPDKQSQQNSEVKITDQEKGEIKLQDKDEKEPNSKMSERKDQIAISGEGNSDKKNEQKSKDDSEIENNCELSKKMPQIKADERIQDVEDNNKIADEKMTVDTENKIELKDGEKNSSCELSDIMDTDEVIDIADEKEEEVIERQSENMERTVVPLEELDIKNVDSNEVNNKLASELPVRDTNVQQLNEKKKLTHISKLSNTLDILSDEEDDQPKLVSQKNTTTEMINLDDDDDVMLIDEDTSPNEGDEKNNDVVAEPEPEKTEELQKDDSKLESVDKDEQSIETSENKTDATRTEIAAPCIDEKKSSDLNQDAKLEEEVEVPKKPLVYGNILKTYKKNLADMTRDELEEFCILKIVEGVVDRSNLGEIKSQLKGLAQNIEEYKKKATVLSKQNRDLQVVLKSVQEEQKKKTNMPITPLKITRSVGMQVLMNDEKGLGRKKIQGANTNAANSGPNKQGKAAQNQTRQKVNTNNNNNTATIPVPRLVPALNTSNMNIVKVQSGNSTPGKPQGASVSNSPAQPVSNGLPASPVRPEKRPHSRVQQSNSFTVDLTDDEPPAKVVTRNAAPPVRLVPPQNLLAPNRQPFGANVNSPRKVYIPISGSQGQAAGVRPGQTIMLRAISPQSPRQRLPTSTVAKPNQTTSTIRMQRVPSRHPAPLPDSVKQYQPLNWKALPPAPELKLSKVDNGIVISWTVHGYQEENYEEIASYQLYAYQETQSPPSTTLWKKIGDVKALPLPMACTLTQFLAGYKYYFAVRAVDIRSRLGPFSLPGSILLLNKM